MMHLQYFLYQAGADVKGVGTVTPLITAANNGQTDFYKCLLEAGADPNVPDEVSFSFRFSYHVHVIHNEGVVRHNFISLVLPLICTVMFDIRINWHSLCKCYSYFFFFVLFLTVRPPSNRTRCI